MSEPTPAPLELAAWFAHLPGCGAPDRLYVFENRAGTPGAACESCGRVVALRGNDERRSAADRALRIAAELRKTPAVAAAARFVVVCIDCGARIPLQRGDRPVVPLCRRDAAYRDQQRLHRRPLRRGRRRR